jgi:D-lactate dehydrogenase
VDRQLEAVVRALADEAVVPIGAGCCGVAGDRGLLLHPELTRSAVRDEAAGLAGRRFHAHVSSNRTCEMGMEQVTGRRYLSFLFLLEELTR